MSRINSNTKGKVGELEFANLVKDTLGLDVRRTAQYNGKELGSLADVVGMPHLHIEVKRVERLNIDNAVEQAVRDCHTEELPTVAHRKNHKDWLITMKYDDWKHLYQAFLENGGLNENPELVE